MIDKASIENLIGTKIINVSLYQKAFTHKSALKENNKLDGSFETLEFLGDSVLGFVITKFLYDKFEERQEGFLTKARTKLVRGETLAQIAEKMNLNRWIVMDEKGMRNEWNRNPKILEDAFEALIGAIYMDIGLIHTREFILRIYNDPNFVNLNMIMIDDNYKDHLMRYCQSNGLSLPVYKPMKQENSMFCVSAFVDGVCVGTGFANNKKQAEQNASKHFFYPNSLNNTKVY